MQNILLVAAQRSSARSQMRVFSAMSSAPVTTTNEYEPRSDEYDEDEAARHIEEFLANLMYQSTVEDGYVSASRTR
jgi:hypothetical protein